MSGSVFHLIVLLLYYLHFGSNSQNQEIIGKLHQIDLYWNDVFSDKMSKDWIVLLQTMQNNINVVTFLTPSSTNNGFTLVGSKNKIISKIVV